MDGPADLVPGDTSEGRGLSDAEVAAEVAQARERYGEQPAAHVLERLEFELDVIRDMGFSAYFLVVWDFIAWAKQQGIPVGPGRGSGAGCLVRSSACGRPA